MTGIRQYLQLFATVRHFGHEWFITFMRSLLIQETFDVLS